jgi:hypothetical protein
VKLKKTPTKCLKLLKDVYGDSFLSRAMVSMWHKRFSEGRNAVEDEEREGRPNTSKTNENVAKISEINTKDRCLSVRMITDMVHKNGRTCGRTTLEFSSKTTRQSTALCLLSDF